MQAFLGIGTAATTLSFADRQLLDKCDQRGQLLLHLPELLSLRGIVALNALQPLGHRPQLIAHNLHLMPATSKRS